MRFFETRRNLAFALALAMLAVAPVAMTLLDRGDPTSPPSVVGAGHARAVPRQQRSISEAVGTSGARRVAGRFTRGYLRYEAGDPRGMDLKAISRFSTPQFGGALLRAPARIPPGGEVPRQRVLRITAARLTLFEGESALLVSVLVGGSGEAHLLKTSVVEHAGRWLVAGIGP